MGRAVHRPPPSTLALTRIVHGARIQAGGNPSPGRYRPWFVDLTTVADDFAVLHEGEHVRRHDGLQPETDYELEGVAVRTLPRPGGELLSSSPR